MSSESLYTCEITKMFFSRRSRRNNWAIKYHLWFFFLWAYYFRFI